jgi:hypothetical protein
LTQEAVIKNPPEISSQQEIKRGERKQVSIQELVESLKSVADDVGQISELSGEERLLVSQFLTSLFKLMQPLSTGMAVSTFLLPQENGNVTEAYIYPTGYLALAFEDGHTELKNLSDDQNRDLMMATMEDIMPKFKSLTSAKKRKIEGRIKFLTTVTRELQKISDTFAAVMNPPTE